MNNSTSLQKKTLSKSLQLMIPQMLLNFKTYKKYSRNQINL